MAIPALDAAYDARHVLDGRPHVRESLVWVLALPEEELGAIAYTWVDAAGQAGAAGVAFGPSLPESVREMVAAPVPDDMGFDDWAVGPMRVASTEPLRKAEVAFLGEQMQIELEFDALHPAYAFGSHAGGCPSWLADERYEQGGRMRGMLRIGGREVAFDTLGHRDHSWGVRDWGGCQHYKWINVLAGDASVHIMDLHARGQTQLRGYVHKDGETAELTAADLDYELDADFFHAPMQAVLHDTAGRTTNVELLAGPARFEWPIHPMLTLLDVAVPAEIDGAGGVSYAEMAWTPEYVAHHRAAAVPA